MSETREECGDVVGKCGNRYAKARVAESARSPRRLRKRTSHGKKVPLLLRAKQRVPTAGYPLR